MAPDLLALLARLIDQGKVTVEIPGLDLDKLTVLVRDEAGKTLREISEVAYAEELTDGEKVAWIRQRLRR